MALVISSVKVTGTSTAYTVPSGKIAKVRVAAINFFPVSATLEIGNYKVVNLLGNPNAVYGERQGMGNGNTSTLGLPVTGFVRASYSGADMVSKFIYMKEDHVLVAGETVVATGSTTVMSYTIFEEDV